MSEKIFLYTVVTLLFCVKITSFPQFSDYLKINAKNDNDAMADFVGDIPLVGLQGSINSLRIHGCADVDSVFGTVDVDIKN
ncbi:MAG: hypothetical protein EOL88_09515 [Bacteroidia bacterium]|nr:hypothetical protein [Bacteroidia bacterium]